jgi:hypothetical protein
MDPEDKSTLRKVLELEQKNNKMLASIQKSMFWSKVFRTIYWVIIIGASIGAYYYVQPYIDGAVQAYGGFKGSIMNFKDVFSK